MRLVAISHPDFFDSEAGDIAGLLTDGGFWRAHIRKPGASVDRVRRLVEAIPSALYPRLSLHDHLHLAAEYGLGGVHLNSRNPEPPCGWRGMVSRSIHTPGEIASLDCDYAFISPVFASISKRGYAPAEDMLSIPGLPDHRVFALGGVTPDNIDKVREAGFGGAAMLGALWRPDIHADAFRLQLITHPYPGMSVTDGAALALRGGCRWVQLRHKDADAATLMAEARALAALCRDHGAVFIVDDNVALAATVGADGVHLGKNDMPVEQARHILGPKKIIGATANTFEDIRAAYLAGADYIGLGPYRFTRTKTNLSPVLGPDGYRRILGQCRDAGIDIPVVAIGGITEADMAPLVATGVSGVAVSSSILSSPDPVAATAAALGILPVRASGSNSKF